MQKKIVAVSLVVLMIAVLLASCGNKYLMAEINGVERPLVTDADGNTEINDEGKIAVYVTDSKGNLQYDSNGEPQKNYFALPEKMINGQSLETLAYKFTMPDGWELEDNGVFYKDGTDEKCYVQCVKNCTLGEFETYDLFISQKEAEQQQYIDEFKKQYPDTTMVITSGNLTDGKEVTFFTYMIKDDSGAIIHYAVSAYVNIGEDIYSANYVCDGGVGYDESFDFMGVFSSGFVVK
jgi:hypothetical protein